MIFGAFLCSRVWTAGRRDDSMGIMHQQFLCPRCSDPVAHPGQFCNRCTTWTERAYHGAVPTGWRKARAQHRSPSIPQLPVATVTPPRIREDLRMGYRPGLLGKILRALRID